MQPMFLTIKQVFRKSILVLGVIGLLMSSIFITQPSYAATPNQKLIQYDNMEMESQAADQERAYEEQIEAEKDIDKVYEENLKEERKENPDEGIVEKTVQGAGKLVDKVTGKEQKQFSQLKSDRLKNTNFSVEIKILLEGQTGDRTHIFSKKINFVKINKQWFLIIENFDLLNKI